MSNLIAIYQRQTQRRDEITEDAGEVMRQLAAEMHNGTLENQHIEQLMTGLTQRLRNTSGKKAVRLPVPAAEVAGG